MVASACLGITFSGVSHDAIATKVRKVVLKDPKTRRIPKTRPLDSRRFAIFVGLWAARPILTHFVHLLSRLPATQLLSQLHPLATETLIKRQSRALCGSNGLASVICRRSHATLSLSYDWRDWRWAQGNSIWQLPQR